MPDWRSGAVLPCLARRRLCDRIGAYSELQSHGGFEWSFKCAAGTERSTLELLSKTPMNRSGSPLRSDRHVVLAVLTGVYTLNLVDRGVMALLLQPIKADLNLTDTQLGLVTGIAFGLFYAVLGLPIARWSDRGNRVAITSLAIGLWGLTVM